MKKAIAVIISIILIICSLTSCGKKPEKPTTADSLSEADERTTSETVSQPEVTTAPAPTAVSKAEYGENTGTDKTLTGYEPLPLIDFVTPDPANSRGLSTSKISHGFGIASDETPHDVSINNQKHFDDGNFKALALDTKTTEKVVYLTFDVGYDNGYTGMILDTLKEKNVKAAFFCTVPEMKSDPDSIVRMIKEGHIVGNHTDTHPSMDELSREEMTKEIKAFDDYIRTNFGYSSPYFRFPKGEYSDSAVDLVGSLGYLSVFWSLAYADWDTSNQKGASYALETVISRIHPGAVILLHAVSSDNAQALGDIIDTARTMGYEFRSLDEYNN